VVVRADELEAVPANDAEPRTAPEGHARVPSGLSARSPSLPRVGIVVSSFPTAQSVFAWPFGRSGWSLGARGGAESTELDIRAATVRFGVWLGWCSVTVVLMALALDVGARNRWLLVGATIVAAAGNSAVMMIPWREHLRMRRGRLLLDLWCGGLIAFVALLVANAGTSFALLLFLVVPFIAAVQIGARRGVWLAVSAATCVAVTALTPLPAGATAMRLALLAVVVGVTLVLVGVIRREATVRKRAAARAELERTLLREANHRIKNDLQGAADLLLLGRPDGADGVPFDRTASRIRSIATVHRLLTETGSEVDAATLLHTIVEHAPVPVTLEAQPIVLDATTAQMLGIVANELITNAFRHGAAPFSVQLTSGASLCLRVDDGGVSGDRARGRGFGLELVHRLVEQGLGGRFELRAGPGIGTRAEAVFPAVSR
jgi:two-component sensor histidine kinase